MVGYLKLSAEPIRFEPVSKVTNVFFDETNKEVLSVRGGGTLGVVVKGDGGTLTFCMDNKGTISSIKFSPDHAVLAIQRSSSAIELFEFKDGVLGSGWIHECRTKGATLLGFIWASVNDLVLVSDHAVEFYQVGREKSSLRFVRSYSQSAKWFVWSPKCHLLLLCIQMGNTFATLQPFSVGLGQITKSSKFEVEISDGTAVNAQGGGGGTSTSATIGERDLCICTLYGRTSVCVLRHPLNSNLMAHLDVYTMTKEGGVLRRNHICKLELNGKFAVNIIDSLIVVHHQTSKTSLVFDILLGTEIPDGPILVYPVTLPLSIRNFALDEPGAGPTASPRAVPCQLYAPTWVIFQPDIIIDARLGCLWHLELCLSALPPHVEEKEQLVHCLLRRKDAKSLILDVVQEVIESGNIAALSEVFDKINIAYREHLDTVLHQQMAECVSGGPNVSLSCRATVSVTVDQAEIYSQVFAPINEKIEIMECEDNTEESCKSSKLCTGLLVGVVLDYIRSLTNASITVQHFLYELIINGLVRTRNFYQLHQLLQYHVLADSKPLACLLLSLVGVYSAGEQLSLDMLSRLNTAHDEITEILLSQKMVTHALRYSERVGLSSTISARKFLEVSMSCSPMIFYSTFKFFALRNSSLRGNAAFAKGEHCDIYVEHYTKLFGEPSDHLM